MGMTETGPTVFLMDAAHAVEKIGSVGKPQLLSQVRLVDADGRDVGAGEQGELLFRGPNITPGYFNNPQATAAAIDRDGWLHSGDVGRRDADGYYFIVDRIKDMYISGGENVYPAEVEAVLTDHAAVLEAAVLGVADERWGEVGHAVVRLRPGAAATPERCAPSRARGSPPTRCPSTSPSSTTTRAPPPARCRSTCCARCCRKRGEAALTGQTPNSLV